MNPKTGRQRFIDVVAWLLALTAMGGSWVHGVAWVDENGPGGYWAWYLATLPEIGVLLSVLKLMDDHRHRVAWVIAASSVGFTLWANGASAEPGVSGMVVALWPAYMALLALGMTHVNTALPVEETREEISAETVEPVEVPAVPAVVEPVETPEPSRVSDIGETGRRQAWVAEQVESGAWSGLTVAETVAAIMKRWDASESTAKRDLRKYREAKAS